MNKEELEILKKDLEAIKKGIKEFPNLYKDLLKLTEGEAIDYRKKYRAVLGREITIPFYGKDIVSANSEAFLISKKIPYRLSVEMAEASFKADTADSLKVYILVSRDGLNAPTGYNVFSDHSDYPYLIGDNSLIRAYCNPKEFPEGKYIKIWAVNSGESALSVNVRVKLRLFPVWKKG